MDEDQVNNAVKTMLQKTNTNQNLKVFTKAEAKPKFIDSELQTYYEQTDLELFYVFDCCKSLKPLKSIDVNEQQIEFFYKEFIRMGWKKKDFDKQFAAVKRATLYNRLDLDVWIKTEIMYNEIDFNVKLSEIINNKIQRGNFLKDKKVELTDKEKTEIDLATAKQVEFNYNAGWYDARQTYQDERREYWKNKFKR